jgi:hypothetical protein
MASSIVNLVRPQPTSDLSRQAAPRAVPQPVSPVPPLDLLRRAPAAEHAWRGASGRLYAHCVYGLIECPPLPAASYVLVRRDPNGRRTALRIGVGTSNAPTLNLAQVRQQGALVGANEVHVLFGSASDDERRLVACDLRAGLFGTLAAEIGPSRVTRAD